MSLGSREAIKKNVLDALQDADEMGGVENEAEYALLMTELIQIISQRMHNALTTINKEG